MASDNYIVQLGSHRFTTNISLPVSENNKDAYLQSIVERQRMEEIALNEYHPKYNGMNNDGNFMFYDEYHNQIFFVGMVQKIVQ